jgi:hypothetical protein
MTIPQLKQECRDKGARTTGRKAELIDRLDAYDRNDDFRGSCPVVLPESLPMPEFPEMAQFQTVTGSTQEAMPKVFFI